MVAFDWPPFDGTDLSAVVAGGSLPVLLYTFVVWNGLNESEGLVAAQVFTLTTRSPLCL
jgi:hypothetical protein